MPTFHLGHAQFACIRCRPQRRPGLPTHRMAHRPQCRSTAGHLCVKCPLRRQQAKVCSRTGGRLRASLKEQYSESHVRRAQGKRQGTWQARLAWQGVCQRHKAAWGGNPRAAAHLPLEPLPAPEAPVCCSWSWQSQRGQRIAIATVAAVPETPMPTAERMT